MAVCGSSVIVGSQNGGVFISTDNGATWTQSNNGLPSNNVEVSAIACDASTFYTAIKYNGFYISTDGGANWTASNNGLPNSSFVFSLVINGDDLFLSKEEGVFHSSDKGANWSAVNTGLTDLSVRTLGIVGQNIFAATYSDGLYMSPLNSISWSKVNDCLPANGFVRCFANISDKIFVGTEDGVYYSDNNGVSWSSANNGMEGFIISSLAVIANNLFAAIASNDGGVMSSEDLGNNWKFINDGFPVYPYVNDIVANESYIYVSGPDNGSVWSRTIDQVTFVEDVNIQTDFRLSQNYPNPFNPATTINFSIPKDSFVTLKIFNLQGEEAVTLVKEKLSAGNYSKIFNAEKFSSGIYYYTLTSGNNRITNKMIFLK